MEAGCENCDAATISLWADFKTQALAQVVGTGDGPQKSKSPSSMLKSVMKESDRLEKLSMSAPNMMRAASAKQKKTTTKMHIKGVSDSEAFPMVRVRKASCGYSESD